MIWRMLTLVAAIIALSLTPARAESFPPLTGRVVDDAHILQPGDVAALNTKLAALEAQSQRQLVVATIADLGGEDIDTYANHLFRTWGIGDKQRNDGVLLVVAPKDRKVRIEIGYGLEGIMTDALSSVIIRHDIVPKFKAGDYPGGINAAVDSLITQLQLPDDQARTVAAGAKTQLARERAPHFDAGTIVFLVIFLLFFVLPFLRLLGGGGRRYGGGVWIMPMGGFGGGGGGGDWGGGDGGFSGGGGSSGGGGASGDW
ncbi:TPM domain-containing protein [Novosphingobium sp.]|uniref:TPM domain-containing protein n=1 Tax=Novosphingobium sp. TaxID=1874826 RepID=UPI003342A965